MTVQKGLAPTYQGPTHVCTLMKTHNKFQEKYVSK